MKIVVLAGGTSTERTVSITSGTGICKALRQKGHQAILVDIFCGIENVDRENPFPSEYDVDAASEYMSAFNDRIEQMKKERRSFFGPNVLKLCEAADIVFLGLHGANGEDGKVQATFDLMGIKYTGTGYLSSALAMDKGITKQMFLMNNVPTPRGVSMVKEEMTTDLKALGMEFPVVVKTCCGGSSVGVYIVNDQAEYEQALKDAYSYENEVVVEEYIKGREFACGVIDNEALPPIEIIPKTGFFDYANKYQADATLEVCPADIPEETASRMMELTVKAFRALKLNVYSRADFLLDEKGNLYCLEMNTLPGMTAASLLPKEAKAAGIEYGDLCELIIKKSLEARY